MKLMGGPLTDRSVLKNWAFIGRYGEVRIHWTPEEKRCGLICRIPARLIPELLDEEVLFAVESGLIGEAEVKVKPEYEYLLEPDSVLKPEHAAYRLRRIVEDSAVQRDV